MKYYYKKIINNDLRNSKLISLTTLFFIILSTMLLALAGMLFINLTGAIDGLMLDSKTPHFMQMHSGELNIKKLNTFAETNNIVEAYQVMEFVNIDDWDILVRGKPLDSGVQDNGVVKQGTEFDFLLSLTGEIINPQLGEIYVPLMYMKSGAISLGDSITIYNNNLTVKGFLRDSQMNSPLSSSKRFLISETDFNFLKAKGKTEYLISFRLNDLEQLSSFEAQYIKANLASNGPTLTYSLFKIINGLSDGLLIGVILLVSFLVVVITFLCIRFTLIARIDDDLREIGVLKAVGLHNKDIIWLYLTKYTLLAFVGTLLGFLAAILFKKPLLTDIKLFMGDYQTLGTEIIIGVISAVIIFTVVISYVYLVLRNIKKVTVTEAIKFAAVQEKSKNYNNFLLSKSKFLTSNVFLGIKDILARKKLYMTLAIIIIISMFMMTVPIGLYKTVTSENFVAYMGVGKSDLRIDIQQNTDILNKTQAIINRMSVDSEIKKYSLLTSRSYVVIDENDEKTRILIETGNHTIFPIIYAKGEMPTKEHQIALSVINAEEMEKDINDKVTIILDGQEVELTVSGIYSDITNGGKTAKATFMNHDEDVMWTTISADIYDTSKLTNIINQYGEDFTYAKVTAIANYVQLTFGSTIRALKKASITSGLVAIFITFLITLLFVKMLIAKDKYDIAILKAIGHNLTDIKTQYLVRIMLISTLSIGLGLLLTLKLGERMAGFLISSFGASSFSFEIDILLMFILCPLLLTLTIGTATIMSMYNVKDMKIAQNIKE